MYNKPKVFFVRPEVGCGAGGWQNSAVEAADRRLCSSPPLCVRVQVYESKLQELQKQVETISLVAETPDEEELEEEEEEEGAYWKITKSLLVQMQYCRCSIAQICLPTSSSFPLVSVQSSIYWNVCIVLSV